MSVLRFWSGCGCCASFTRYMLNFETLKPTTHTHTHNFRIAIRQYGFVPMFAKHYYGDVNFLLNFTVFFLFILPLRHVWDWSTSKRFHFDESMYDVKVGKKTNIEKEIYTKKPKTIRNATDFQMCSSVNANDRKRIAKKCLMRWRKHWIIRTRQRMPASKETHT